jgi:DNA mismatch repair protein MSH6
MDADVGVKELDLIYMKGAKGHSGFPEVSYGKYAGILVSKGYVFQNGTSYTHRM